MKTITKKEWKSSQKHGYTSIIKGERHVLTMVKDKGTCLVPVKVKGMRPLRK